MKVIPEVGSEEENLEKLKFFCLRDDTQKLLNGRDMKLMVEVKKRSNERVKNEESLLKGLSGIPRAA